MYIDFTNLISLLRDPLFNDLLNFLTIVLLAFTFYANLKSSYANAKSNELSLLPFPIIYFEGDSISNTKIYIKNVGHGIAYNIEIDTLTQIYTDVQEIINFNMEIKGTNLLDINEKVLIKDKSVSTKNQNANSDLMKFQMNPHEDHQRDSRRFFIKFKNALNNTYYLKIETGAKGLKVLIPPTRLNLVGRVRMLLGDLNSLYFNFVYKNIIWRARNPYIHMVGAPLPTYKFSFLNKISKLYYGKQKVITRKGGDKNG